MEFEQLVKPVELIGRSLDSKMSDDKVMFQVKCADCGCLPEECRNSPSAKECPNCSWDECCCWATIVNQ